MTNFAPKIARNPRDCAFGPELLDAWDAIDNKVTFLPGIRALVLEDRYYLLVVVLNRPDMWHPWTYERCREVERNPDGYLDLWAREHGKSSIITFAGIIQEVLRNPEITCCIFSHTAPRAKAFLAQIKREFENNKLLKTVFSDIFWDNPNKATQTWSLDAGITVQRKGNPKEATIEAHGLVDAQPVGKHYALMVYDDVVVPESVSTPEQVHKTTKAWELSDNLGTQFGRKWHIGTRYNYADTYEAILKRGSLTPRIYPATNNGQIDGEPVLFSKELWLRKVRDQGPSVIACQMLQDPLQGSQAMFDVSHLQIYEIRPQTLNVFIMVDPARSKKKDSANTAICVLGMDYAGNKYLLDGWNHRMDLQERWTRLRDTYIQWMRQPGVQNVRAGYEAFGAQSDFDYFQEKMTLERFSFDIVELAWPREGEGSKIDRVQRLGPDFRQAKFFLPYETDPDKLTSLQARTAHGGHPYRIARPIRRKDSDGNIYDLSTQFKEQVHYFPFGTLKDLVDAASRIYDMDAKPPIIYEEGSLEPEIV